MNNSFYKVHDGCRLKLEELVNNLKGQILETHLPNEI